MASEKNPLGHCWRCGFQYPLRKLIYEHQPNKEPIRVCKSCFDPLNVRNDPEQWLAKEEDTSLDDAKFQENFSSMFSWDSVGNLPPVIVSTSYFWL